AGREISISKKIKKTHKGSRHSKAKGDHEKLLLEEKEASKRVESLLRAASEKGERKRKKVPLLFSSLLFSSLLFSSLLFSSLLFSSLLFSSLLFSSLLFSLTSHVQEEAKTAFAVTEAVLEKPLSETTEITGSTSLGVGLPDTSSLFTGL